MALIVVGWLVGWLLVLRPQRLDEAAGAPADLAAGGTSTSKVSVVIPARNEADRIGNLLESLAGQRVQAGEIVVVDDHSTDETGMVANRFPGVEVIAAAPLPPGWTGKAWACHAAAEATSGDRLVFLDADVELHPDALASLIATHDRLGGLVSVQPIHRPVRAVELLSLPFNVVAVMGLGIWAPWHSLIRWGAAGPCMVVSRADYEAAGGHAHSRGAVDEDLALARGIRAMGGSVRCFAGDDRFSFRMYRNAGELAQGWSKNIASGARRTPIINQVAVAIWVAGMLAASGAGASAFTNASYGSAALIYGCGAIQFLVFARMVGRFRWAPLVWPLLMALFVTVFSASLVLTFLLRRVRWSGRTITLPAT